VDVLHQTEVTPDQIDHLGHMNVRFYSANAREGAEQLLASLGLVTDEQVAIVQRDSYVRHHREQLVGARLEVRGGVLDATADRVRVYEELANVETGDLAATFILAYEAADRDDRSPAGIHQEVVDAALAHRTTVPAHGRPRSISLDADPSARAPSLEEARRLGLALRQVRAIDPVECDDDGFVRTLAVPELVWGGEPVPERQFRPLEELADGVQMGFATMETRATWATPARAGDRIQSFGTELDVRDKVMMSRHWLFDVDRGDLIAVFSVLNVAFDTSRRRAMVIPDAVRDRMVSRLHPELGDA
jgi:acyl-CoA thioesterase FadM